MKEEIKYCVNHKGQKIKPYKTMYEKPKKVINWEKILGVSILITICLCIVILGALIVSQHFNV
jgi:hypothetical protein|tara:strand:+ start:106 stop:294 length:189 start_codon:yes stop_codon:yes gene_type:complete